MHRKRRTTAIYFFVGVTKYSKNIRRRALLPKNEVQNEEILQYIRVLQRNSAVKTPSSGVRRAPFEVPLFFDGSVGVKEGQSLKHRDVRPACGVSLAQYRHFSHDIAPCLCN